MWETIATNSMADLVYVKPHKGRIVVDAEFNAEGGLGYGYYCFFLDHIDFAGKRGRTSYVVRDDRDIPRYLNDGYEIETRNSRYTVVPYEAIAQDLQNPE